MEIWNLLLEIVALLGVSLVLGGLFSRFGQSPLVGYLLAGMVLVAKGGAADRKTSTSETKQKDLG